jgi:hypothetical protein
MTTKPTRKVIKKVEARARKDVKHGGKLSHLMSKSEGKKHVKSESSRIRKRAKEQGYFKGKLSKEGRV